MSFTYLSLNWPLQIERLEIYLPLCFCGHFESCAKLLAVYMAFVSAGEQASELILLVFSPCSKKFLCWKIFLLNSVGLFLPLGIWSSKKEFCTMLIVRILSDHSESLLVPLQSQKHILERCNFINWLCLAAIVTTLSFSIISLPTPKIIVIDHWVYRIDFYPILLISLSALYS